MDEKSLVEMLNEIVIAANEDAVAEGYSLGVFVPFPPATVPYDLGSIKKSAEYIAKMDDMVASATADILLAVIDFAVSQHKALMSTRTF